MLLMAITLLTSLFSLIFHTLRTPDAMLLPRQISLLYAFRFSPLLRLFAITL